MINEKTHIKLLRENILESLLYVQTHNFVEGDIDRGEIKKLLNLVESFSILSRTEGNKDLIREANLFENNLSRLINEYSIKNKIFEYGFENPFNKPDESSTPVEQHSVKITEDPEARKDIQIRKVRLWNKDTANKVVLNGGKMVAGQPFDKGDIIERCPLRYIKGDEMYSKIMRKLAFTIDGEKGVYAVPFGYATYYRNSKECGEEPNADYFYDKNGFINIVAIKRIKKWSEIVLKSDESDFVNEVSPDQFVYEGGLEYYSVKSYKFI